MKIPIIKNPFVFDNPPDRVLTNHIEPMFNRRPISYSFNPQNGNFAAAGDEYYGGLIIQPLHFRWKTSARHGQAKRLWLDVLFQSRLQHLGLLSLPAPTGYLLSHCFQRMQRKRISLFGAWLRLNRYPRPDKCPYMVEVSSYYWATDFDCLNAERKLRNIRLKPWEQADEK